eukprot:UN22156
MIPVRKRNVNIKGDILRVGVNLDDDRETNQANPVNRKHKLRILNDLKAVNLLRNGVMMDMKDVVRKLVVGHQGMPAVPVQGTHVVGDAKNFKDS